MSRKRTPTAIKIVTGRPGRVGINENEPQPPGNLFDPPEWLSPSQKMEWNYAIESCPIGVLRRLDRAALLAYVIAVDMLQEATKKLQQFGMLTKTSDTNPTPIQSPYMQIVNKQIQNVLRAVSELGFSPVSRTRLSYAPVGEAKATDPAERFFKRNVG